MGPAQEQQKQAKPILLSPGAWYFLPPLGELKQRASFFNFLVEEICHLAFSPPELFYFRKIKSLFSDREAGGPPLLSVAV